MPSTHRTGDHKGGTGKRYIPTDEQRRSVRTMTAFGINQNEICAVLNITAQTLHRHYRTEIDRAQGEANARVARALFDMATKKDNVAAAIFWLKCRAKWSEREKEPYVPPESESEDDVARRHHDSLKNMRGSVVSAVKVDASTSTR